MLECVMNPGWSNTGSPWLNDLTIICLTTIQIYNGTIKREWLSHLHSHGIEIQGLGNRHIYLTMFAMSQGPVIIICGFPSHLLTSNGENWIFLNDCVIHLTVAMICLRTMARKVVKVSMTHLPIPLLNNGNCGLTCGGKSRITWTSLIIIYGLLD